MATSFYAGNVNCPDHIDSRVASPNGRGHIDDLSRAEMLTLQTGGLNFRELFAKAGLESTRSKRGVPTTTQLAKQGKL